MPDRWIVDDRHDTASRWDAMTASRTDRAPDQLERLRAQLRGVALTPGDDRYESARRARNFNAEHRPALVVVAEDATDIRCAV